MPPELGLQQNYLVLQSQNCNKRISGKMQESSKGVVFRIRGCNKLFIYPESATTRIVGQETKIFLPPESGLHRKGSLARFRNPAKGSFPRFRIATEQSFLQSQDCNKNYLFLQRQDCNKRGLWPDSGNQQRISFPDSGLQRIRYSSGVRMAAKYLFLQS